MYTSTSSVIAKQTSFHILSKLQLPDLQNPLQPALKQIKNPYHFKPTKTHISLQKQDLLLISHHHFNLHHL
ncbi:DUF520 family protein, partial [Bacillus pumilus]|uniref:DUF520 family protein n=1 Tax=Bacillus pumilus TaxID=1408 RepID=UPI0011AA5D40